MNVTPISTTSNAKGCSTVGGILFGGIFFVAGGLFFWMVVINPVVLWIKAASWPVTEATITKATIEENHDSEGSSYRAAFTYDYTVAGKPYSNDRYGLLQISGRRKSAKKLVDQHPVGSKTSVYYDPLDPRNSLMNRTPGMGLLFGLIPLVFLLVGGGIIGWFVTGRHRTWSEKQAAKIARQQGMIPAGLTGTDPAATAPLVFEDDEKDQQFDKPLKLRPEQSRIAVLVGIGLFALFWNGIVSVFVYDLFDTKKIGIGTIGLGLFLIPFVVVGLGSIVVWIYTFMTLFNPKVEIALSNGAVPIGGEVDLAWEVIGNTSRIRKLKIQIEGIESATYRRGTSTYTDTETFLVIPVVETDVKEEIQFGSHTITIPATTMHSLDTGDNQIKWLVKVLGDVPLWPDVSESLAFRVTP
jgi:hypothetical protein